MFWIHGGGYVSGANIQYPGHFLVARGVVVVVINYRLNHLGTDKPISSSNNKIIYNIILLTN